MGRSVEEMMRSDVKGLEEYIPVQPLERLSERIGIPVDDLIKLDANENPYGPSPRVREALAAEKHYHIYPDPSSVDLRQALSGYVGIDPTHILAGAGSDELIELIVRLFVEDGDNAIDNIPTFGMYSMLTGLYRGRIVPVPRRSDFTLDLDAVERTVDSRTKVIFVASPNNPTGNTVPEDEVKRLLAMGPVVVIDEAYYEFSGRTYVPWVLENDNLIVLRTFSKLCGLAGLRVGYGIFPEPIIRQIWKIKQPYNVNLAAQVAAIASLADIDYLKSHIDVIVRERERVAAELGRMDFLRPHPSEANFIFCRVIRGDAQQIKLDLERRGILIRYFKKPLLENAVRISIGTPEQNDVLLKNLREIGYERAKG